MESNNKYVRPVYLVITGRKPIKAIILSIVTLGIYAAVYYSKAADDLNVVINRYDGKTTMKFGWILLLAPVTLGAACFIWFHRLSDRIEGELDRRDIAYFFGPGTFWLWGVAVIIAGPFIYMYKFTVAVNKIIDHYNIHG